MHQLVSKLVESVLKSMDLVSGNGGNATVSFCLESHHLDGIWVQELEDAEAASSVEGVEENLFIRFPVYYNIDFYFSLQHHEHFIRFISSFQDNPSRPNPSDLHLFKNMLDHRI